jgi:DNA processing protein
MPPSASNELTDCWRLARTEGVGPIAWRRLLSRYGSAAAALDALPRLARAGGRTTAPSIPSADAAQREIERLGRLGAQLLVLEEPGYPPLLAMLEDAPPVIAVQGDPGVLGGPAIAMVGGRNASSNGQRMAEHLAAELARALVVVSGLARGIDAAAHAGALATGRTVAVVAGGLDVPYPQEHAAMQQRIAETGAVVAEAPLGTTAQARHFPRRNRIIAGLSLGVVVVEAALRSGSLITARIAQDAGREIFAVPGSPLDPRARGTNDLLRQGAILTESAADVLQNLPDMPQQTMLLRDSAPPETGLAQPWGEPPQPEPNLPRVRSRVVELLGPSPTPIDDLVRRCQFSPAAVMAVLLELELAGRIETLPGNRVALLTDEAHWTE